jgi:hypothetical protein
MKKTKEILYTDHPDMNYPHPHPLLPTDLSAEQAGAQIF